MSRITRSIARVAACVERFRFDTAGNVAIIFAVSLPVLIGASGLGLETSYWFYRHLQLQSAADVAAYAGQVEQLAGSDSEAVFAAVSSSATSNGYEADVGTIAVHSPPTSGPNTASNATEVVLRQNLARFFTAIFSDQPVVLSARAVAMAEVETRACILALDAAAPKAVYVSGSSDLQLTGCSVNSNSTAADAITVQGSAQMTTDCIISAGGVQLASGAVSTVCPAPMTNAFAAADPFADLPVPPVDSTCQGTSATVLQPGTYCSGLRLSGTVTLSAGIYVISGGDLKINANADITGDGVTIYLKCGAEVSMNGTAAVNLSAPTTGPYSGVLFYGDRTCSGGTNTFNGTAASSLTGALYFARQTVKYLGNFTGNGGCSQVVAGIIEWSGNTAIEQDCSSMGMRDIPAYRRVRLAE